MVLMLKYMHMNMCFRCVTRCSQFMSTDELPCWLKERVQSEPAVRFAQPSLRASQVGAVSSEEE